MNGVPAPRIDKRTFRRHLHLLAREPLEVDGARYSGLRRCFVPKWRPSATPSNGGSGDLGVAMEMLFARLMDVLVEHLNRVPEKHFTAFLDLIGLERRSGMPARVPVTFSPAPKTPPGRQVPSGTQVATTQTETSPAVTFETEDAFDLIPITLAHAYTLDPAADRFRDIFPELGAATDLPAPVLLATPTDPLIEHSLYVAQSGLLSLKTTPDLSIRFQVATSDAAPGLAVAWQRFDGERWVTIDGITNGSAWLTGSGPVEVVINGYPGTEPTTVQGQTDHWIRAVVTVPLPADVAVLPSLAQVTLKAAPRAGRLLRPEAAFTNTFPIDLNRDFFPFGAKPAGNDAFYFRCEEAFTPTEPHLDREVTFRYRLAPVPGAASDQAFPDAASTARLSWEYWSLAAGPEPRWERLAVTPMNDDDSNFKTVSDEANPNDVVTVRFPLPSDLGSVTVNGVTAHWIRVRIADGDYGKEASSQLEVTNNNIDTYTFTPASFRPPFFSNVHFRIEHRLAVDDSFIAPSGLKSKNHDRIVDHLAASVDASATFSPLVPVGDILAEQGPVAPALYLGYVDKEKDKRVGEALRGLRVSQLFSLDSPGLDVLTAEEDSDVPALVWEYLDATPTWRRLDVVDETRALTSSAIVAFTVPRDIAVQTAFGHEAYWIRVRLGAGTLQAPRLLRAIHLNSVMTRSIRTIRDELLGSGTGESPQEVRLSQTPVLPGERILVREINRPSDEAIAALEADEAARARELGVPPEPVIPPDPLADTPEIWVRWYPVPSFRFSSSDSRHYVIDRVSGQITFGSLADTPALRAKPVPLAKDNIRAELYQATGGGEGAGARGSVTQLKSGLPFVAAVTNPEPAEGGSKPETLSDTLERGPQVLKHRNRAVTIEDFDALAREANSAIRLVKTLPTTNRKLESEPGSVTVLIVPDSAEPRPQPSAQLMDQVRDYLALRGSETAAHRIYVIGPSYIEASVTTQVVPVNPAEARVVGSRVSQALAAFLHPLSGGRDNRGWPFGRAVHISEIYAMIEAVEGVDFVPSAAFRAAMDPKTLPVGANELVSSGSHDIQVVSAATALTTTPVAP